ncbi:MAG: ribosome small subunit-dependent GTPase A [Christensenellales bacterium]|jgi:ribosome biogenesis GTPase
MREGLLYKGVGGFYSVLSDGKQTVCRAAGRLRLDGPLKVGDRVLFEEGQPHGFISEMLPRKNELVRPAVANIDVLVIVLSPEPKPDYLLCDKLLLQAHLAGVEPVLFANKEDMGRGEILEPYVAAGFPLLCGSAINGTGVEALLGRVLGKICCMAGQSGVGKSSLLNAMLPGVSLPTAGMSRKTARGTHTTRHVELLALPGGGYIADTPGFSVLAPGPAEEREVVQAYPEFRSLPPCRFSDCLHCGEEGCALEGGLEDGKIHPVRYQNYIALLDEISEWRKKQYD